MDRTVLVTEDGVLLATRSWSGGPDARAVVVLVHGFAASKDDPKVVTLAGTLMASGLDVISYDARGHGQSEGTCTLGDLERHDVAAAVGMARDRTLPVVLVGASMGGIAVLRYASTDEELAGVVIVSSPSEWRVPRRLRALLTVGLTRTRPGHWVTDRHLRVRLDPVWSAPEPPREVAGRLRLPVAIVHGHRDRLIPHHAALDLYASVKGIRRVFLIPGMGHAFDLSGHGAICEAVDWVLDHATGSR